MTYNIFKMVSEWQPEEYSEEEVLSLDRLKRAVMNRVYKRATAITGAGEEYLLDQDKTAQIVREEWARAKEAVKSSKAAPTVQVTRLSLTTLKNSSRP